MNENNSFFSMATRKGLPLPVRCSCPTNSSRFLGLILDASGSIRLIVRPRCVLRTGAQYCTIDIRSFSSTQEGNTIMAEKLTLETPVVQGARREFEENGRRYRTRRKCAVGF